MIKVFKYSLLLCVAVGLIGFGPSAPAQEGQGEPQQQAQQQTPPPAPQPAPQAVRKENPITAFFSQFYTRLVGGGAEPDPSGTMIAPFETDTKPLNTVSSTPLPVNSASLNQPHRSASDLAETLQQLVAESLSFTAQGYPGHLKALERSFTTQAIAEFNAWATATGIVNALQQNQLQLNGFVSDLPFLLNEGVVSDRYRWLYEIPVMVSFVPLGTTGYRAEQGTDSRRLLVTLQIGRSAQSTLPDQVLIESWSVKDNTRRN